VIVFCKEKKAAVSFEHMLEGHKYDSKHLSLWLEKDTISDLIHSDLITFKKTKKIKANYSGIKWGHISISFLGSHKDKYSDSTLQ